MLEKYLIRSLVPILLLTGAITSNSAYGSLVFEGPASGKGAGIGASNIVLTIQAKPSEQGCVSWDGTADVIGSGACPGGLSPAITGGDEKTGSSQTQTRTVGVSGVLSASSLVIIMNLNIPGSGGGIMINNVSLTIFSPTGSVLFNSGDVTGSPVTVSSLTGGQGNLGIAFQLDSTEAAAANPFICTSGVGCSAANANNRFGLAASLSNTAGANDDLAIADTSVVTVIPEPGTIVTFGAGLLALGIARWLRRARGAS